VIERDTLGSRIRDAEMLKIPYMAVIGKEEEKNGTVALRKRGSGKKQEVMEQKDLIERLQQEIEYRVLS
jgi:threonyl-tRNA synthetase